MCLTRPLHDPSQKGDDFAFNWLYVTDDHNKTVPTFTLGTNWHIMFDSLKITPEIISTEKFQEYIDTFHKTNSNIVNIVNGTSLAYHEFDGENFGHVLTDTLLGLYTLQDSFGSVDANVNLYEFWPKEPIGWSFDFWRSQPNRKHNAVFHCERFQKIMTPLLSKNKIKRFDTLPKGLTCFDRLLVGYGLFFQYCDDHVSGDIENSTTCLTGRQGLFRKFREFGLANMGIKDVNPTKQKVLIWHKEDGSRDLKNIAKLAKQLRHMFTKVEIQVVDMSKLSLQEQLDLISSTTVYLTVPGGAGYISVFLPYGTTQIRLYNHDMYMEWFFFNYLGYMHIDYVNCPNNEAPISEVVNLVAKGLDRYTEYGIQTSHFRTNNNQDIASKLRRTQKYTNLSWVSVTNLLLVSFFIILLMYKFLKKRILHKSVPVERNFDL